MPTQTRFIAALELALIFPAALFMTALLGRNLQPQHYELAVTAQRIVMWYSARMWTLWVLLLALPIAVLFIGCSTMLRVWKRNAELANASRPSLAEFREQPAALFLAATTLTAAGIVAIVILHMLAN